ncbi:helix-turn-helix transcriptional regulator [Chromobacterium haemolyticum]|uniref:helix-turn-helix transcriptional regulator n=1 Tax=Chromobacterium haemolyticum TaxID=394935 RepID=UPI0009F089C0|nr:AlpA family phage regulatory protein [Chromobacterium haemolyticum]OQS39476.1 hypothetical protein B0T39_12850 [Chromobacterium haemolyticum]
MSRILYTMKEIRRLTGFHPATIYRKIKKNEFPEPIKIGTASHWPEEDYAKWRAEYTSKQRADPTDKLCE